MDKALSDHDIEKITRGKAKIILYKDLKSLDSALGKSGAAAILYPIDSDSSGHWVALLKHPDSIEVFDPYGVAVDSELKWNHTGLRNQILKHLLQGHRVIHNNIKDQRLGSGINTCGRWTALRILLSELSLQDFNRWVAGSSAKDGISKDMFVTKITNRYLQ